MSIGTLMTHSVNSRSAPVSRGAGRDGSSLTSVSPAAAAIAVASLATYILLQWISFIHQYKGVPITPWNPGLGMIFALMVYAGPIAALLRAPGDSPTALAPIPDDAPPVVVKPLRRPQFAALLTRPPVHSADVS